MSAYDRCEPEIIRALGKAGWVVARQQYLIRLGRGNRGVFADLLMQHTNEDKHQRMIVVEVKCFTAPQKYLDNFYEAIGQYQVYRNALRLSYVTEPLYLALPHFIYQRLLTLTAIHDTIQEVQMNLIVVDLTLEEVVEWLP